MARITQRKAFTAEAKGLRVMVEATERPDGTFEFEDYVHVQALDEDGKNDGDAVLLDPGDLERAAVLVARIRRDELGDRSSEVCADHGPHGLDSANNYRCPVCHPAAPKLAAAPDEPIAVAGPEIAF